MSCLKTRHNKKSAQLTLRFLPFILGRCAYVTLLTNDNYIPGVLALGQSLRDTKTQNTLVVMVTEHVSRRSRYVITEYIRDIICECVVDKG